MPKVSIDWRELAYALVEDDANKVLDSMKSMAVTRCNQPPCTICTDPVEHKMKYQLLKCTSASCKATCPQLTCGWRGKVMTCNRSRKVTVLESGNHFAEVRSPRKAGLTREQKKYCQELTAQRMKPVRVRNALRLKFGLKGDRIPRLRAVQNFANYYSKTQLGCNDEHEDISEAVQAMAYEAGDSESTPISFTYGKTSDGRLVVGDGSDEEPFVVGITTKALLKRLDRDPSTFIFHIDATFKLSQVNYPVLVMGISDRARKFHLVAFCMVSQRIEPIYTMALLAFRSIYLEVTGKQVRLKYVMGDAEDGQLNALERVFRYDSDFIFLMCFFHVMKKVQERTKSIPDRLAHGVLAHIYDMHFSSTVDELNYVTNFCLKEWSKWNELAVFSAYFTRQWMNDRYSRWQCCYTEPGFATTNNPVEQCNRVIKRGYRLRARLKIGLLIRVLSECCANESHQIRPFRLNPEPTAPLLRRAKQLAQDKLLQLQPQLANSLYRSQVRVVPRPAPRSYIPSKKRTVEYLAVTAQMGLNYAWMEYNGQPTEGWLVDVSAGWCQCKYWKSSEVASICCMRGLPLTV